MLKPGAEIDFPSGLVFVIGVADGLQMQKLV